MIKPREGDERRRDLPMKFIPGDALKINKYGDLGPCPEYVNEMLINGEWVERKELNG